MKKFKFYQTEEDFNNNIYQDIEAYKIFEIVEQEVQIELNQDVFAFLSQNGAYTVRIHNLMKVLGIKTLWDLTQHSFYDFRKVRNVGRTTLMQIETALSKHNLKLKDWF